MIYDTVDISLKPLLDPRLTASWEKGLTQVAEGSTTEEEYQKKLDDYVRRRTEAVKRSDHRAALQTMYRQAAAFYSKPMHFKAKYAGKGGPRRGAKKTGSPSGTPASKT